MSKPPAASARAASSANQNGGGGGGSGRSSPQGDTVPMTPEKELYPRRLPRIGIQFQTRIPKSTAPSDRPAPFLMSVDFPYLSRDDVQKEQLQIKSTLSTPPVIKKRPEESQTEEGSSTTTTNGRWPSKQKQSSEFPQGKVNRSHTTYNRYKVPHPDNVDEENNKKYNAPFFQSGPRILSSVVCSREGFQRTRSVAC